MENLITANIRSRPTRTFISILAVALGVTLMLVIGGIATGTLNDSWTARCPLERILSAAVRFFRTFRFQRRGS